MVQPLQKIVWQFFKKLNRITIWFSNPTLVYISKITENRDLNRSLCIHAHSSTFHNSQKAEATQVFMTWIDKQNVVYKYNGILLSLKRNEILKHATTCMNFDDIRLTEINQSEKDLSCVCVCAREHAQVLSHAQLCDPMDYSPPGFSAHGTFQARIQKWAAISYSWGSSQPRDQTCVSCLFCIVKWTLYQWATWEAT